MDCRVYIKSLDIIDSTNRYVRDGAERLWQESGNADIIVVTANEQTEGRGQRGNLWFSQAGKNLLLTLLVRPAELHVREQFALSQVISLAVLRTMSFFGIETEIKWPNDIYAGNRKLAGVLVELDCMGVSVEKAIIGVGLNINQNSFPSMDRVPVSMSMLSGYGYSLDVVRDRLLASFRYYYSMLMHGEKDAISVEYKEHLKGYMATMQYRDRTSSFEAVINDVMSDGKLSLELSTGEIRYYSFKELELLL